MTTLYGHDQLDAHPEVVTYYYAVDGEVTIGYWQNGKIYLLKGGSGKGSNLQVDAIKAKHISLTDTDQVLVLNSKDYKAKKLNKYFSNIYSDHKVSNAVKIDGSGQTIVFKSNGHAEAEPGKKAIRHAVEGLIKSTSSDDNSLYLLVLQNQVILGQTKKGKLENFKIIDKSDSINLGYHTLAFYQHNDITPETLLRHYGLKTEQLSSLEKYLPQLEALKVPKKVLSTEVDNHTELIPHYLAYLCAS